MSSVGENIRKCRMARGISQVKLAEAIGETKQTVWKYESGTVTNIPLTKVEAIAEVLSCEPARLLGWEPGEGKLSGTLAEESSPYLTAKEAELIEKFKMLNRENKDRLLSEADEMLNEQLNSD